MTPSTIARERATELLLSPKSDPLAAATLECLARGLQVQPDEIATF
ncbi:hypothetical protein [Planctellipticum variicoloris]|nr:hypothetical protein SH412_000510 [Planctomycetaceae bacterium SH412]